MKPLRFALIALSLASLAACVTHEREVVTNEQPVVHERTVIQTPPVVERDTTVIHEP